jgi:hypothetical protein
MPHSVEGPEMSGAERGAAPAPSRRQLKGPAGAARRALPGAAICLAGLAMLVVALGQPAWLGGSIGPGLMARAIAAGVIVLGAAWAIWCALSRPDTGAAAPQDTARGRAGCTTDAAADTGRAAPQRHSGPALLAAVLAFALAVPVLGLVAGAALAAAVTAWGAGERALPALVATATGLGGLTALIGVLLLPPTAPLWPGF